MTAVTTIRLAQATLIAEHTGFASTELGLGVQRNRNDSGKSFSVYHSFTEIREVEITISVMSATYKSLLVKGIPKGMRKAREFPSVATELAASRSIVLNGWGHASPPNPRKLGGRDDRLPNQIGFNESSKSWDRNRKRLFEDFIVSVGASIVVDFPSGIGCGFPDSVEAGG